MRLSCAVAVAMIVVTASIASADPENGTVVLTVEASSKLEGTLRLRSLLDAAIVREVKIAPQIAISEASGSQWEATLTSAEWWMEPLAITFPSVHVPQQKPLKVWRTGIVTGSVTAADKDLELPKTITLQVESPPWPSRPQLIARGTSFVCPVGADGKWSCRVPATTLDLVLRSPGITPNYRWNVSVSTKEPANLGVFALRKGASLLAWLDRDAVQATAKEHARARLLRPVSDVASPMTARLRVPVAEAAFSDRGFVQLAPLPAGTYSLEVLAPGFAPTRIGPIEIYEGKETAFRKAIGLSPPLAVTVRVEPVVDPSGSAWQINWQRLNDVNSGFDEVPPVSSRTDEHGSLKIPNQVPGLYNLNVRDAHGNALHYADIRIQDMDIDVAVKINIQTVKGKLTLGADPLKATLWFGTRNGAQRVEAEAAVDGAYEAHLPHRGTWAVEIVSSEPAIKTIVEVTVPEESADDVDIRLPDTTISGVVIGTDGKPVGRCAVNLATGSQGFANTERCDGTFTFRAAPVGTVRLRARDLRTDEESRSISLQLTDGTHLEGIELRIESTREVNGSIVSRGEPVVGARVRVVGIAPSQSGRQAVTDVNGGFSVQVDSATQRALVMVAAPGKTLQTFETPIGQEPLRLEIAPIGGTLEIVSSGRIQLTRDGIAVPDIELFDWVLAHGQPLTENGALLVADLAPGQYQLCSVAQTPAIVPICKNGLLAPGSSLRLEVP